MKQLFAERENNRIQVKSFQDAEPLNGRARLSVEL
jgi:hypothetical protein